MSWKFSTTFLVALTEVLGVTLTLYRLEWCEQFSAFAKIENRIVKYYDLIPG
ncbi:MAG: hypothetical protein JO251_08340 [Verrucomicrobia bacterium]|nr:hypothetical protein [Verrucomicrobiota bacterium]